VSGRGLVWFRRDLRLVDNPAWAAATRTHDEVVPVFVLDPTLLHASGPFRRAAVLAAVAALDDALDGRLHVASGDPVQEIPRMVAESRAARIHLNADVTPYATRRDAAVARALDVPLDANWGTVIHPPGSITTSEGTVPRVFTAFWRRWQERPLPAIPAPGVAGVATVPGSIGRSGDVAATPDPRAQLDEFVTARLAEYPTRRDLPALDGTSQLSIALKTGALGPVTAARVAAGAGPTGDPWVRQLCWRDWYAHLLAEQPHLVDHAQRAEYDRIRWRDDPEGLAAWREGRTGVPIVDAGMRQLAGTGWMHNRVRMITASFLVKDLLVDWRHGEQHFRHLLADGDVPQNVGNWQWVAGTGPDAAPYFRVFNPTLQSRRFDPGGDYLRRWIPELAGLDATAIHEPSTLGPLELAAAGVTLGENYPEPIVDHRMAAARAVAAYKVARAA
jgi:deoxyribodipyrimidine photo-lyase